MSTADGAVIGTTQIFGGAPPEPGVQRRPRSGWVHRRPAGRVQQRLHRFRRGLPRHAALRRARTGDQRLPRQRQLHRRGRRRSGLGGRNGSDGAHVLRLLVRRQWDPPPARVQQLDGHSRSRPRRFPSSPSRSSSSTRRSTAGAAGRSGRTRSPTERTRSRFTRWVTRPSGSRTSTPTTRAAMRPATTATPGLSRRSRTSPRTRTATRSSGAGQSRRRRRSRR